MSPGPAASAASVADEQKKGRGREAAGERYGSGSTGKNDAGGDILRHDNDAVDGDDDDDDDEHDEKEEEEEEEAEEEEESIRRKRREQQQQKQEEQKQHDGRNPDNNDRKEFADSNNSDHEARGEDTEGEVIETKKGDEEIGTITTTGGESLPSKIDDEDDDDVDKGADKSKVEEDDRNDGDDDDGTKKNDGKRREPFHANGGDFYFGYRCIYCLEPTDQLYRTYDGSSSSSSSSSSSKKKKKNDSNNPNIKLADCPRCGEHVDPYVEREWLLVAMDMVLLRRRSYRHVLYNRLSIPAPAISFAVPSSSSSTTTTKTAATAAIQPPTIELFPEATASGETSASNYHYFVAVSTRLLQSTAAGSIIQSYLAWEGHRYRDPLDHLNRLRSTPRAIELFLSSIAGTLSMVVGSSLALYVMAVVLLIAPSSRSPPTPSMRLLLWNIAVRVYVAILIPCCFYVVTNLVQIWESTSIVRFLSSLLVASYQVVSMQTVVLAILHQRNGRTGDVKNNNNKKKGDPLASSSDDDEDDENDVGSHLKYTCHLPFLAGLLTRTMVWILWEYAAGRFLVAATREGGDHHLHQQQQHQHQPPTSASSSSSFLSSLQSVASTLSSSEPPPWYECHQHWSVPPFLGY